MRLVLLHERADRGQRPAGAAREVDGQRIGGGPECGYERHPDDRADAVLQDAEPVAGLGRLGQPVADHRQERHLHALLTEQPGRGHRPARRGQRAAGHEQDRAASGPQRAAARGGPSHHAQVPGGTQQRGQGGQGRGGGGRGGEVVNAAPDLVAEAPPQLAPEITNGGANDSFSIAGTVSTGLETNRGDFQGGGFGGPGPFFLGQ